MKTDSTFFESLVENAPEPLICVDEQFRIIYGNAQARERFHWGDREKEDFSFFTLLKNKEDASILKERLAELKQKKSSCLSQPFKLEFLDRSGRGLAAEVTVSLIKMADKIGFAFFIREHTLALQDAPDQHLQALRRLAAKVAEDFTGIISVIKGYAQAIAHQMPARNAVYKQLEPILKATEYAEELIEHLAAFGQDTAQGRQLVNLRQVYFNHKNFVLQLLGKAFVLREEFEPQLWMVEGDPEKLGQVLLNLVVNARDAMPKGGPIEIRLKNRTLSDNEKKRWGIASGARQFVVLKVKDQGKGMTKKVLKNIFKPYFSTDSEGKRKGLGLSLVYGVVKAMQGTVLVDSQPGKGSTFTLYFPACEINKPKDEEKMEVSGGKETILVVEDVPEVQVLLLELLQTVGYQAIGKSSYQEALDYYVEHADEIDMIISDVVLPDNYGTELIRKLLEGRPDLKYLLISGYAEQIDIEKNISLFKGHFLQKPFQPTDFLNMVRKILDEK